MDALLTPTELCRALKISARTYHRLVQRGLPCRLVMSARRFVLSDVLAWLPMAVGSHRSGGHGRAEDLVARLKARVRSARTVAALGGRR